MIYLLISFCTGSMLLMLGQARSAADFVSNSLTGTITIAGIILTIVPIIIFMIALGAERGED